MLFLALGMTAAVWLLAAPLVGLEAGIRADLAVGAGIAGLLLACTSVWLPRARIPLAALGIALGFANFAFAADLGALTSMASCAVALIAAGTAPRPSVVPVVRAPPAKAATAAG
jgi:hypothetical protein